MKIACDTSPIIFLAQINKLDLLKGHTLLIPKQVADEIRQGKETGHPDYDLIEKMMGKLDIKVIDTKILKDLPANLGEGERAAISLAVQNRTRHILIDEARARKTVRLYGLTTRGTLGVILEEHKAGRMKKSECKNTIFSLIGLGYRIDEAVIAALLKEME